MENYDTLKEKGLVKILKTENSCAFSFAQFSQDTGEQMTDKVQEIKIDSLVEEKAMLEKRINEIEILLKDIEEAPLTKPESVVEISPVEIVK